MQVYTMIRFRYKLGFLSNCLKLTSAFEFSSSLRDLEFRCGFYFFNNESWCSNNFRYFQGKSRLIFYLELLCSIHWKVIESKFKWHFLFLQLIPPVSKQFWPWCYAQHNGNTKFSCPFVSKKERMVGLLYFLPNFYLVVTKCLIAYNWNNQHIKGATKT